MSSNLSEIRKLVYEAMEEYANKLQLKGVKVLDVGIAGDPPPSEKYQWFGEGNDFKTLDIDPQWKPDFVGDICQAPFINNIFDLVIVSQTLEHIFDFKRAISEIYRITKKYAIIDCPFVNSYHPESSFDDYWRISHRAMKILLETVGFKILDLQLRGGILTTALVEK